MISAGVSALAAFFSAMRASSFAKSLCAASAKLSTFQAPFVMLLLPKCRKPRKGFPMRENPRRETEISRREREKMRAELIATEMASAVRLLGGDGSAKEQVSRAAHEARLPLTVIERLRWKKIKRVPADIADAIREAVERHNEESLSRAKHELEIERAKAEALRRQLERIDADYGRALPIADRRADSGGRRVTDIQG
jgi:hypothetical protein